MPRMPSGNGFWEWFPPRTRVNHVFPARDLACLTMTATAGMMATGATCSASSARCQAHGSYPLRVTVWNEFLHERHRDAVCEIYPEGIHTVIAEGLQQELGERVEVRTATLEEPEHGLSESVLAATDVLVWWGHVAHDQVQESIVQRVQQRVLHGMGFMPLHSAHLSQVFVRLMGTSCMLRWRDVGETERLWIVNPFTSDRVGDRVGVLRAADDGDVRRVLRHSQRRTS